MTAEMWVEELFEWQEAKVFEMLGVVAGCVAVAGALGEAAKLGLTNVTPH